MKNALIKLVGLMVLSIAIPTSLVISLIIEEKFENIEEEKRMEQQRMLNESQPSVEDYEEMEKIHEQNKIEWEEKVKEEIENNPNFEENYNKIQDIEKEYLEMFSGIIVNGYTEEEEEELKDNFIEVELNELELEEGSILNELKYSMILYYKWDYCPSMDRMNDLEEIIEDNLN